MQVVGKPTMQLEPIRVSTGTSWGKLEDILKWEKIITVTYQNVSMQPHQCLHGNVYYNMRNE